MGTYSAPGVYRREINKSDILIATGVSTGGIVVRSLQGPIKRPVLVTNDKEYIDTFGIPFYTSGMGISQNSIGGTRVPEYGYGPYGALTFLGESESLFVVRAFDEDDLYAYTLINTDTSAVEQTGLSADSSTTPEVFDTGDRISTYEDWYDDGGMSTEALMVGYTGPGTDGNDYAVTVEVLNPYADWLFSYDEYPIDASATYVPTTSADAASSATSVWNLSADGGTAAVATHYPIASKVVKVSVFRKPNDKEWEDLYSNSADREDEKLRIDPLEVFYGSMTPNNDADGNDIYIENAINGNSNYIYVKANTSFNLDANWDFDPANWTSNSCSGIDLSACELTNLRDGLPYDTDSAGFYVYNNDYFAKILGGTAANYASMTGGDSEFWDYFENREELPEVAILINTNFDTTTKLAVSNVVSNRRDMIAVNPVTDMTTTNYVDVIADEKYGYPAPSYMALYSGYSKIYDKYNDKRVFIPNSIYGASLMARVDRIAEPWFAPAGAERGTISVEDQNKIYSKVHIGNMYNKGINSVQYLKGSGFAMMGQKTAQLKDSALNRVQVRRSLLYIENNIEEALNRFVFENNTQQTRLRVFSVLDEFLAGIKAGDGLYEYSVVCDESNNTAAVIDSNQLNVDIYVQPVKAAEFIQFTTVVTRTGVSISDVKLKYA